jgi:hypothetical protein
MNMPELGFVAEIIELWKNEGAARQTANVLKKSD